MCTMCAVMWLFLHTKSNENEHCQQFICNVEYMRLQGNVTTEIGLNVFFFCRTTQQKTRDNLHIITLIIAVTDNVKMML